MVVVPGFGDNSPSIIVRSLTSIRLVVPGSTAANVWKGAGRLSQRVLDIGQSVLGRVARYDTCRCKPVPCRVRQIVLDGGLEEVYHVLMLCVIWTIAWYLGDC